MMIKLESLAWNGAKVFTITFSNDFWHLWSVYTHHFIFRIFLKMLRSLGRAERTLNISQGPIKRKLSIFLVSSGPINLMTYYSYGNECLNPRNPENILDNHMRWSRKIVYFCPVLQFCLKENIYFSLMKENIFWARTELKPVENCTLLCERPLSEKLFSVYLFPQKKMLMRWSKIRKWSKGVTDILSGHENHTASWRKIWP